LRFIYKITHKLFEKHNREQSRLPQLQILIT
jgi:hypothetical protein